MKTEMVHDRYKIEIKMQDETINTLGVPGSRSRFHAIDIARKELSRVPAATHAIMRGLCGGVIYVYNGDGWLRCQLKALKLK